MRAVNTKQTVVTSKISLEQVNSDPKEQPTEKSKEKGDIFFFIFHPDKKMTNSNNPMKDEAIGMSEMKGLYRLELIKIFKIKN